LALPLKRKQVKQVYGHQDVYARFEERTVPIPERPKSGDSKTESERRALIPRAERATWDRHRAAEPKTERRLREPLQAKRVSGAQPYFKINRGRTRFKDKAAVARGLKGSMQGNKPMAPNGAMGGVGYSTGNRGRAPSTRCFGY